MDRKSKQKIKRTIAGLLMFLCFIGILCWGRIKYEEKLRDRQRQELETIYPELREPFEEILHTTRRNRCLRIFGSF